MPELSRTYFSIALKISLFVSFLVGAHYLGTWVVDQFSAYLTPSTEPAFHRMIMTTTVVYILLMAIPFVPGVEIGLGLIAMFGPRIVPLVYVSTVLALMLAFLIGRLAPQNRITEFLMAVRLRRAAELINQLESLDSHQRLVFLLQNASTSMLPFLLRHRFLALALVLNLPGNALIGGGGGICMIAGFSRLFTFRSFLLTLILAVSPVPLIVIISGSWVP